MRHFKREALIQTCILPAIVSIGVLAASIVPRIMQWTEKDKCLDAGGAYNAEKHVCIAPRSAVDKPPQSLQPRQTQAQ
jgi:hypothetical protein